MSCDGHKHSQVYEWGTVEYIVKSRACQAFLSPPPYFLLFSLQYFVFLMLFSA